MKNTALTLRSLTLITALFAALGASNAHGECSRQTYITFSKMDVNNDGLISPIDLLNSVVQLTGLLNQGTTRPGTQYRRLDANEDGHLSPLDILLFTNLYRSLGSGGSIPSCNTAFLRAYSLMRPQKDGGRVDSIMYSRFSQAVSTIYAVALSSPQVGGENRTLDVSDDGKVDVNDALSFWNAYRDNR